MITIYLALKTFLPIFSGLEISDVLRIDDKDYSITFSLYFNVQWSEPRLNLSREFLDTENITAEEDQLVPGKKIIDVSYDMHSEFDIIFYILLLCLNFSEIFY